ncbi:MAG: hypothetical protein MUD10_02925 [Candidatus Pacebacteria bacterium]|jgi:hypothetical protein|nr:hypothetical protein [Candidatus Paceibacterota bacterium]
MEQNEIANLRCRLAADMASGKIADTLRRLKDMPINDLQALNVAEMKCQVDCALDEMDIKQIEKGMEKLDFYVCGILMHRVLEGE